MTGKINALYSHLPENIYDAMPTLLTSTAEIIHSQRTESIMIEHSKNGDIQYK